jgi:hypothetical protein
LRADDRCGGADYHVFSELDKHVSALGSLAPSMMQVPPMKPGPWRAGEVDSPKDQRNRRPRISTMGAAPVVTQMLVLINEIFVRCKNI